MFSYKYTTKFEVFYLIKLNLESNIWFYRWFWSNSRKKEKSKKEKIVINAFNRMFKIFVKL